MAKNQNTYEKRRREMEQRQNASEKRMKREQRKKNALLPAHPTQPDGIDDNDSPEEQSPQ